MVRRVARGEGLEMAARNYQPTLRLLLHTLNRFITRYQALLLSGMTPDQAAALATLESAVTLMSAQLVETGGV